MHINLYFMPMSVAIYYIPYPPFISGNHYLLPKVTPTKILV